ncbi:hypothetical protein [uncultured Clostridium sp.]|uniref:hypothetical protein n=1 Tax=uncultured Clostridium sp. TaxID=59620 RepID=UPI0026060FD8|nr:hypothetical protein [uncultured Clostridium sp.]
MIIKAIVLPTPMRIKKKFKKLKGDEIFLYSLIGGGILLISLIKVENKVLPIFGLSYCGLSYAFLKKVDDDVLEVILKNNNYFYRI